MLQEAAIDVARRAGEYAANPTMTPYLWLRFLTGRDEAGRELPLDDPLAARLRATVTSVADDPAALVRAVLAIEEVFGPDLRRDAVLTDQLTVKLARIFEFGARPALPT